MRDEKVNRVCPKCGGEVPGPELQGLCPGCVARLALGSGAAIETDSPAAAASARPRYFGDYELLEELARGGMGVIYKSRQLSLNRMVAIKMILAGQLASPADVQRFLAEAEAAANLQHPNIVAIHEVGQHDGQHYFSMDYIEGKNLAQLVAEGALKKSDFKRAARYLKMIAEAIHFAHEHGTLHRDLKPSNVLIDRFDQPRITDFGLAKRVKQDSDLTVTGQVLGTPNFMPPEQAAGKRGAVGPASDVYSLGAILYFLVTGKPPFAADTVHETLIKVTTSEPEPPRRCNPTLPRDLETICLKCLEKEPSRRYTTAAQMAADLDLFLKDEPITAVPVGRAEKLMRSARKHRLVVSLVAAVILLPLMVAVVLIQHNRRAVLSANGLVPAIAPMPTNSAQGVSGVIKGKVYVATPTIGWSHSYPRLFHMYDPASNTWKRRADTLVSHLNGAAGVIGDKLYVVGGNEADRGRGNILEVYDPASDTWTFKAHMPTARAGCAAVVLNGKLYVIGGHDATNCVATMESYDPVTDRWSAEPSMPTARSGCGAAVVKGRVYVVGGDMNSGVCTDAVDTWAPGQAWTTKRPPGRMPVAVANAFVAAANEVIYVMGGTTPQGNTAVLQIYSPQKDSWLVQHDMPEVRYCGDGAQVIDGEIWIFGGWTSLPGISSLPHPDVFAFDPAHNSWRRSTPVKEASVSKYTDYR